MVHPKDRNNTLCPHEYWEMGPTIFKTVGLVPKSSKTIARSQIKCASCEICFYHLGLESPDLSPPLKTCISVTSAIVPTTGNACLKQAAATPLKGKLLMPIIHGPALLVSIWTKMKRQIVSSTLKKRACGGFMEPNLGARKTTKHLWSFKQSLKNYEEQIKAPNISQPAPDEHLNNLQKQGFSVLCHPRGQQLPALQCRSSE